MRPGYLLVISTAIVIVIVGAMAAWTYGGPHVASSPHRVEFVQESNCPYGSWLVPWAVMINQQTAAQPSNATLPLSYSTSHLTGSSTYSTISLHLASGTYTYTIFPAAFTGQEQTGNVTVNGSDVVIQVSAFVTAVGCSTTISASSG